jgi:hypothetical protein
MRTNVRSRLATVVLGGALTLLPVAAAGATPAGTWTVEGTTLVAYDYESQHIRSRQPFATRLVVHDDGTIDGEVIGPTCGSTTDDPITFTATRSGTGRGAIAAALRAFIERCYGEQARLRGVHARVRVSDDGARLHGRFRAHLRIPFVDDGERESLIVRLRGTVDGRLDQ